MAILNLINYHQSATRPLFSNQSFCEAKTIKQLSFLFAALVFCATSFAQVHFGIDQGLAISRGSFKSSVDYDRRIFAGFDGGVFVEVGVTPKFMIQPEVNYSICGVELNNGDKEATIKLRYFDLPVLAKFAVCPKFNYTQVPKLEC
jgi:outer membrane protein with beta-barrel domain